MYERIKASVLGMKNIKIARRLHSFSKIIISFKIRHFKLQIIMIKSWDENPNIFLFFHTQLQIYNIFHLHVPMLYSKLESLYRTVALWSKQVGIRYHISTSIMNDCSTTVHRYGGGGRFQLKYVICSVQFPIYSLKSYHFLF